MASGSSTRPDGWVASDEAYETQPHGVSACQSLGDLIRYCRTYGLTPQPEDVILRLEGSICDRDRDDYAVRVEVERVAVVGRAERLTRLVASGVDPDRVDSLLWQWS